MRYVLIATAVLLTGVGWGQQPNPHPTFTGVIAGPKCSTYPAGDGCNTCTGCEGETIARCTALMCMGPLETAKPGAELPSFKACPSHLLREHDGVLTCIEDSDMPKPEPMDVEAVAGKAKSSSRYAVCISHSGSNSGSVRYSDGAVSSYFMEPPASLQALRECQGDEDLPDNLQKALSKPSYYCADTHRVLLTDESGHKHCILFPPQEAK